MRLRLCMVHVFFDDMKKLCLFCLMFIWCCQYLYSGNNSDVVLLKIDGSNIYLSEYEDYYRSIDGMSSCSKEDYFYYFLRYKLKVCEAIERKLDKDERFIREFGALRQELLYNKSLHCVKGNEQNGDNVVIQILTYRLRQNEDTDNGLNFMKILYSELSSGVSIIEVTRKYPDEMLKIEEIHDLSALLNETKEALGRTPSGEYSKPFASPEGVHIVRETSCECETETVLKHAYEALLIAELEKNIVLAYGEFSDYELERYFKSHKKKYKWEYPHYKGAVVHCKSKKVASKIKGRLKKLPMEQWTDRLNELIEDNADYQSMINVGLFSIGENEYVDKLAFKCGDFKAMDEYPYTFLIGKRIDYMPDSYKDVYETLLQDYKQEREKLYFGDLERKFKVEKYIDVLKTVNSCGSN